MSHHNLTKAQDITTVQYSLPYCLATAAYRDPRDPDSFLNNPYEDTQITALAQKVRVSLNEESLRPGSAWATQMTVVLRNGLEVQGTRKDFRGAPSDPMSDAEFDAKFMTLAASAGFAAPALLKRLRQIETIGDMRGLLG